MHVVRLFRTRLAAFHTPRTSRKQQSRPEKASKLSEIKAVSMRGAIDTGKAEEGAAWSTKAKRRNRWKR